MPYKEKFSPVRGFSCEVLTTEKMGLKNLFGKLLKSYIPIVAPGRGRVPWAKD